MEQDTLFGKLYNSYSNYKISEIKNKRFSHADLMSVLQKFSNSDLIKITNAGYSVEGREIKLIKVGTGKINIMAWSQMHGDESTATMALLDFLQFVETEDEFLKFKKKLLKTITLYILPMLNPDGVEKFERRNGLGVDINRDALRLQSPESRILKNLQVELTPKFAFNLHDQATRYTVGDTGKVAALAFLSPTYNHQKEVNNVRRDAMKLISQLTNNLNKYIPGHIAKYSDDFEPRAFGDNFIKWGTSLVLVESGGWKNNYDKNYLRKLNFVLLITGFASIADESYKNELIATYEKIPENRELLFDVLLRNVTIEKENKQFKVDVGINQNETSTFDDRSFYFTGVTKDIGDLSPFYGFEEVNCDGLMLKPGLVYPEVFNSISELDEVNFSKLLRAGYLFARYNSVEVKEKFVKYPINLIEVEETLRLGVDINNYANFILTAGEEIKYVCLNGFLHDLNDVKINIPNGLII